nr:uncharacterized protein KIAA1522 [Danio rerio]|eukprot:XP_689554.6 uncharacterized protein KIAA1522 [Danio rerio]
MSSGRESIGDLIPLDMLQVFSEERQHGRGKRGGRRAASFRRAFKWFKSQRRKTRRRATEKHGDLLATGSPVELPPATLNTGLKEEVVGTVSLQQFQENVFVEGDRPKYVLDLHTEAQQGLKLQQQEDDRNGTDFPDDQSMISTVTAQTEDSMAFSELRGFESESTAADSVSMRSSISSRSTRSGLKRQASTFRPLKPDKSAEKPRTRRKPVRNVVGIPRHVQKELGLDRAAWITTNALDYQLSNGDVIIPAIITAVDGVSSSSEQESLQDYPQRGQNLHILLENNTEVPMLAKHKDILQRSMNQFVDPGTLGVPENQTGAVMSISPQATYLSKIIPNAVLPPSVDVVELSRSRSRSSVRTVSKSSLVSASPASTRASSRVSSHRSTTRTDYSGWSNSGSSETLVSNSSTISSSSTPRVASRGSQFEHTNVAAKLNNHSSHVAFKPSQVNGDSTEEEDIRKAATFTRNLSVIKRGKMPPPPPNRSYSLRNGKQSWKKSDGPSDLDDVSIPDVSPYPCIITSSETKTELSPKSGLYSSNGTTLSKEIQAVTEKKNKGQTNGTSKLAELKKSLLSAKSLYNGNNSSPAVMALLSLLEIPTHPKVLAPPAPPPETWAHNQRSFELLCGPGPINYARWAKKRGLKVADETDLALGSCASASELQPVMLKGKVESLTSDSRVAPSPSPLLEHCPPLPVISQANPPPPPPDFVPSTPTLAAKAIKELTTWIPPPPLFPPPAPPVPPVSTDAAAPFTVPNDKDFPPPPPPFSPKTLQSLPQLPPGIPPPPPQAVPPPPPQAVPPPPLQAVPPPPPPQAVPPPPPQAVPPPPPQAVPPPPAQAAPPPLTLPSEPQKIPSPPKESRTLIQNVLVTSSVTSQQINVPPLLPQPNDVRAQLANVPPPLPTDVKCQVSIPPPPSLPTDARFQRIIAPPPPPLFADSKSEEVIVPPPPPLPADAKSQQIIVPPPPPQPSDAKSQPIILPHLAQPADAKSQQVIVPAPPSLPADERIQQVNISPAAPPPLPLSTDVRKKDKLETMEVEKRTSSPSPAKEESSSPMVTQSLLQMVRLRSVKSNQTQAADLDKPSQAKPKSGANQEAPPKPIRRSLILTSLPPDLESLSSTEPKTESPSNTVHANITTVTNTQQGVTESEPQSNHIDQTRVEPTCSSPTEPSTASAPTESVATHPIAEPHLKPQTLKEQIQPSVPVTESLPTKTVPKDQLVSKPLTQLQPQGLPKTQHNSDKQSSIIEIPSKINVEQPKIQTPTTLATSTPPVGSSAANPSMRLQDAIRLKAAAMSSKDNQAKLFGLRSPPAAIVTNSPASTASFIFSKSTKKVVIDTPSSLEVQADLKKTLVSEFTSVTESAKSNDLHKTANKVPPPIAKKPNGKVESVVQNSAEAQSAAKSDSVQTETVQTAGQEVQTENSEKLTKE